MLEPIVQALFSGVLNGAIYALMALGLTLVWGSMRFLNMAHGTLYLAGGYLAWLFIAGLHLPMAVGVPLAVLCSGLLGLALYLFVVAPTLNKAGGDNAALIATIGVSMMIESAVLLLFGPEVRALPPAIAGRLEWGGASVPRHGLVVIVVAVVLLAALNIFLKKSRHGLAIRALSQDKVAARLMGIRVGTCFALVTIVSAALAGLAGALLSSIRYLRPDAGAMPLSYALMVTILGGLGSIRGTMVAAFLIGIMESGLQVGLPGAWAAPVIFGFMIVVLIVRPNGLFGLGEARRL